MAAPRSRARSAPVFCSMPRTRPIAASTTMPASSGTARGWITRRSAMNMAGSKKSRSCRSCRSRGRRESADSQALSFYRDELDLAAAQAIVVGHSMGGVLARVWASEAYNPDYRRPENFGEGDIDRLLTVNTPHHGSELVELKDAFLKAEVAGEDWLEWGRRQLANTALWWFLEPESGALRDLRPGQRRAGPDRRNPAARLCHRHPLWRGRSRRYEERPVQDVPGAVWLCRHGVLQQPPDAGCLHRQALRRLGYGGRSAQDYGLARAERVRPRPSRQPGTLQAGNQPGHRRQCLLLGGPARRGLPGRTA